jgi:hypothetical protein
MLEYNFRLLNNSILHVFFLDNWGKFDFSSLVIKINEKLFNKNIL